MDNLRGVSNRVSVAAGPRTDATIPTPLPRSEVSPTSIPPVPALPTGAVWVLALRWLLSSLSANRSARTGRHLRALLERLGGLWVPFAQLLARQTVRFSPEFCDELKQTRHGAVSFSFA